MKVLIDGKEYVPTYDPPTDSSLMAALEFRFDSDAGENITIRDYLFGLLTTLWNEGDAFSGKRPFGNSGWEYDLYYALIKGGFVPGDLDEFGFPECFDEDACSSYVRNLISAAFYGVQEDESDSFEP